MYVNAAVLKRLITTVLWEIFLGMVFFNYYENELKRQLKCFLRYLQIFKGKEDPSKQFDFVHFYIDVVMKKSKKKMKD